MFLLMNLPIPDADPMPVPGPIWLMKTLLLVTFTLHLLFMNLSVGGSLAALVARWRGKAHAFSATLANDSARMLPVLVAFTITLGVAPLLFLQVLYGQFFYASTILMAGPWLSLVGILIVAYYSIYFVAYRGQQSRGLALAAGSLSLVLLLFIGFLQVNTATLMLTPESWQQMYAANPHGWQLNLAERTLAPRYLHFMVSAIAVAGAGLVVLGALKHKADAAYSRWLIRYGSAWFTIPTMLQYLVGFWFLAAMPRAVRMEFLGGSWLATTLFMVSFLLPFGAIIHFYAAAGRKPVFNASMGAGMLVATVAMMVVLRDLARTAYLRPHFTTSQLEVAPQWIVIAIFVLSFLGGLATVAWMLRKFAQGQPVAEPAVRSAKA